MSFLYNIAITITTIALRIIALFNEKLNRGLNGRKESFRLIESVISKDDKTFWFHCASLGEYEQGLPVFEALKQKHQDYKVAITFFSPSGYEVRKNTAIADIVAYLPWDTKHNAKKFLDILHPDYVIFVKYEIWPNFLGEIKKRNVKAILISALFRENQSFFKWYGKFMRQSLFAFQQIFTQDIRSKKLLEAIGYTDVMVAGDTRFDRVYNQLTTNNQLAFIEQFVNNERCIVFGSTWPADEELIIDFINTNTEKNLKIIIAPHDIKSDNIISLKQKVQRKSICYSNMEKTDLAKFPIFILDTIGLLSKVYSYANIAYVGGGAGNTGLHNILEPAVFSIPIIIGKNYEKFPEAISLINLGGVFSVRTSEELNTKLNLLLNDQSTCEKVGSINGNYISENKGAVNQILDYIRI